MKAHHVTIFALLTLYSISFGNDLKPFEPKSMVRGYCYAGSRNDDKALGGYGPSDNTPKKITDNISGTAGKVNLIAMPTESVAFAKEYRGFRLLLVNRTGAEASFAASDSRLTIICEAQDDAGEWKPIEDLPSSFCGNSHHNVFLPSGHYWEFTAPLYSGSHKTKLRFQLKGKEPIYSNVFDGSINPAQFVKPEPIK